MSVVNMSSSRSLSDTTFERIAQLAVTLSGELTRVHLEDVAPVIAGALDEIADNVGIDSCVLVELAESGIVARTYAASRMSADAQSEAAPDDWLVARLARGEVVAVSRLDDLPRE